MVRHYLWMGVEPSYDQIGGAVLVGTGKGISFDLPKGSDAMHKMQWIGRKIRFSDVGERWKPA